MAGHETDNVESKSVQQADNTGDSGVGQQIAQSQNDGSFSQTFQNQQAESAKASEQMAKDGTLGNMSIGGMDSQGSYGKDGTQSEGSAGKDSAVNESPKAGSDSNESPKAGSDSNESPKAGADSNQSESKSNIDDMVTTAPGDSGSANDFPSSGSNDSPTANSPEGNNKGLEPKSSEQNASSPMHGPDTDAGSDANPGGKEPIGDVGPPPLSQAAGPDSASKEGSEPANDSNGNPPPGSESGGKQEGDHIPRNGGDANGQQSPHAGGDANGGKQDAPEQGAPSYDALGNYQGPYGQANSAEANNENPVAKPNSKGEQSPMGTMQDHMDSMKQQNGLGDSLKQPPQNDTQSKMGVDSYTTTGAVITDTSMINQGDGGNQMDMSPKNGSAQGMDDTQKNDNAPSESQSSKPSENNQKPDDSGSKNNNEGNKESHESKPNVDKNRGGGAGFGRPSSLGKSAVPANSPRW